MPCDRAQVERFVLGESEWRKEGRGETGLWGQECQKRKEGRLILCVGEYVCRGKEKERKRWELGSAPLKGDLVTMHRRCS